MIDSLYIAETGMQSQQRLIDVISNNIANASTPGFKQSHVNFVDLVVEPKINANGEAEQLGLQGLGVQVDSVGMDFSLGELKQTNNAFDLAINGAGFIEVEGTNGDLLYTRAGRLRLNDEGFITTTQGYKLSAGVQVPPDAKSFSVSKSGEVSITLQGEDGPVTLGNIGLVNFHNPSAMVAVGDNLFRASNDSGHAIYTEPGQNGTGELIQGFTELSNVSMTEEMVNLMLAQRGYQLNARIIQVSDQIMETINNLRR